MVPALRWLVKPRGEREVDMTGWMRTAAVVLAILGYPPAVFPEPCTCADIPKVEQALKDADKMLELWRQVSEESAKKWFPTGDWANRRFRELWEVAFPGLNPVVLGEQKYGRQEIYVSEEQMNECDGISTALREHELDHVRHDQAIPDQKAILTAILGQQGVDLAIKEIAGHALWVALLASELARLQKECRPPDPPEITGVERYEAQMLAERARQKELVAAAAARVTAYSRAIM
jgi:hypothetical protein